LFHDGPPGPNLDKSAAGLLLRFEQVLADALADRARGGDPYVHQVAARCAVAALRSAGIRQWQVRMSNESGVEPVLPDPELVARAFAILRGL